MKNYYKALAIPRNAEPQHLVQCLDEFQNSDSETVADATAILLNVSRRKDYTLLHAQYESIALVCQTIGEDNILDTNNWAGRISEFKNTEI